MANAQDILDMLDPYSRLPHDKRSMVKGAVEAAQLDHSRTANDKAKMIARVFCVNAGDVERLIDGKMPWER